MSWIHRLKSILNFNPLFENSGIGDFSLNFLVELREETAFILIIGKQDLLVCVIFQFYVRYPFIRIVLDGLVRFEIYLLHPDDAQSFHAGKI